MSDTVRTYVPALGFRRFTRFYDLLLRAFFNEEQFKRRLIGQAQIQPGYRVLDLGCGTATLTIMLKRACPEQRLLDSMAIPTSWPSRVRKSMLPA